MSKRDPTTGNNMINDNYNYIYLHENGDLIVKSKHADPNDFEDSDLVLKYWKINLDWRGDGYTFLISAKLSGANPDIINKWISDWGITDKDTENYLSVFKLNFTKTDIGFEVFDETEIIKGVGDTLFNSLYDYTLKMINNG
jgi:hypothetical protein